MAKVLPDGSRKIDHLTYLQAQGVPVAELDSPPPIPSGTQYLFDFWEEMIDEHDFSNGVLFPLRVRDILAYASGQGIALLPHEIQAITAIDRVYIGAENGRHSNTGNQSTATRGQ